MLDGCDLLFARRDDRVRMLAENHAAEAFAREKAGRSAFDAQTFDFAAAFALEFLGWERSVTRQIAQQIEKALRKFSEAGNRNRAGISAGVRAQIRTHAAQILFDLAAGARARAGAHDGGRQFGEAGRTMCDTG